MAETKQADRKEKIDAQYKLCKDKDHPHFAPGDGYCGRCRKDIYSVTTLESAGKYLITGCPHCNRSYCD